MTSAERRIVTLTMASHALVHFYEQTFPPVLKLVEAEFGLGLTGAGGIGNVFPLFFGLGALPAGMAVDRWGPRRTIIAYLVICAFAAGAITLADSLWVIAGLLALMGVAAGLYHPAGVTLISHNVKKVGSALGMHGVGGNLGLAVSPMIAAAIAAAWGWRPAYAVLAIPALALAVYFLIHRNFGNGNVSSDKDKNSAGEQTPKHVHPTQWLPLVLLFILGMLNGFCYRGMVTFLPAFFGEGSTGAAEVFRGGLLTTAVLVIGVFGQYTGGRLADRYREEILYAASFTFAAPILIVLGLLNIGTAAAAAGLFAFIYFANQPVGNSLLTKLSSPTLRGRAYGIFFFTTFGMGSFSATISGWVGERFGLAAIWPFLGGVLLLVAIIGWALAYTMKFETYSTEY